MIKQNSRFESILQIQLFSAKWLRIFAWNTDIKTYLYRLSLLYKQNGHIVIIPYYSAHIMIVWRGETLLTFFIGILFVYVLFPRFVFYAWQLRCKKRNNSLWNNKTLGFLFHSAAENVKRIYKHESCAGIQLSLINTFLIPFDTYLIHNALRLKFWSRRTNHFDGDLKFQTLAGSICRRMYNSQLDCGKARLDFLWLRLRWVTGASGTPARVAVIRTRFFYSVSTRRNTCSVSLPLLELWSVPFERKKRYRADNKFFRSLFIICKCGLTVLFISNI